MMLVLIDHYPRVFSSVEIRSRRKAVRALLRPGHAAPTEKGAAMHRVEALGPSPPSDSQSARFGYEILVYGNILTTFLPIPGLLDSSERTLSGTAVSRILSMISYSRGQAAA